MKIFIDDIRDPPDDSWIVARNSSDALNLIRENLAEITHISFDHDLGGDDTSRPIALWLEEYAFYNGFLPIQTTIHSANPVGRKWLEASLMKVSNNRFN